MNNRNNDNRNRGALTSFIFLIVLLVISLIMIYTMTGNNSDSNNSYIYSEFQKDVDNKNVEKVVVNQSASVPTGTLQVQLKDKTVKSLSVSDVNKSEEYLTEKGIPFLVSDIQQRNSWGSIILQMLFMFVPLFLLFAIMRRGMSSMQGGGMMGNFAKSKAKLSEDSSAKTVTFKDVAGLKEEKEELEEIVDFLKNPERYTRLGAHIPKGVMLAGPPGTGKTLLAKAVAGEAGVPFFSISGSDFVEMFVGVGAARVRDMFTEAKNNAPCIIFIDEIDAVARQRGAGLGGGHDEREQTLNQLLVEMDGFSANSGVIVMAATNRIDILDPAILRPGRFDRKIVVGYPDREARLQILKVHSRNKPLADDVDLESLASVSVGFTGADLANIMNEAAIAAAIDHRQYITNEDVKNSFIREGIGVEKKSRVISDKDKLITAYHETGHAILFHELPDVGPVHIISIIPTGMGAAGYTMPLPEKDELFNTKGKMMQNIMVSMGGRIAEEIIFDDVTTGASQDIKQASQLARDMVTKYGFSKDLGFLDYSTQSDELFIGRELAHSNNFSEQTATKIDEAVKEIIDECYARAKQIILDNKDVLERTAKYLIKKEKISREEFEAIFRGEDPDGVSNNAESKEKSDNVSAGINGHNNADNNSTVENNVTDIKTPDDSDSDQKDEKGSNEEHGNNESDKKDNKPDDGWIY
ncbi:MAG: ATP-dependent zinc metalloprotease FtsH [Lachnospiraceae bacterium]|nr:ATP-dependent zinc metalloprotease FtsH [Lachnospiraceae bacterium]